MICDVTMWTQNDVKITKYGISVQITKSIGLKFCRVDVLQELCTHFDNNYDVTIATYSLPDLYLPKIKKNASFVAPESNGLSCACAV